MEESLQSTTVTLRSISGAYSIKSKSHDHKHDSYTRVLGLDSRNRRAAQVKLATIYAARIHEALYQNESYITRVFAIQSVVFECRMSPPRPPRPPSPPPGVSVPTHSFLRSLLTPGLIIEQRFICTLAHAYSDVL